MNRKKPSDFLFKLAATSFLFAMILTILSLFASDSGNFISGIWSLFGLGAIVLILVAFISSIWED